jgi:Protein of unknwon function (DUF3008)
MPAESVAQRKAAGMARALQEGEMKGDAGPAVEQMAKMPPSSLKEFAHTKESNLPMHKHKHHKAQHGRATSNEMGRRRNPRGGSC